jgi:Protein of unknown function (DUF1566)
MTSRRFTPQLMECGFGNLWGKAMKSWKQWAAAAILALTGAAQAALIPLGDGTVRDDSTNLIWLVDWNSNQQKTTWGLQNDWAQALNFAGSQDWELPTLNEFATLFAYLPGPLPFIDVQAGYYWTRSPLPDNEMFAVNSSDLIPNNYPKYRDLYAVAVRAGGQAAPVPEPGVLGLSAMALGALALSRRRQPAAVQHPAPFAAAS